MPESNNQWLEVTLGAEEDRSDYVQCVSLSFDGGSLICFADEGMRLDTGTPTRRASSAITVVVAVVVTWASFQGVG